MCSSTRLLALALFGFSFGCTPDDKGDEDLSTETVGDDGGSTGGEDDGGSSDGDDGGSGGSGGDSGTGEDSGEGSAGGDDAGDEGSDGTGDGTGSGSGDEGGTDDGGGTGMDIDVADLDGHTWQLELSQANISDPAVLGAILSALFTDSLFLGVTEVGTETLDMSVVVGSPNGSGFDLGTPLALGSADFSAPPDFEVDGTGTILEYTYDRVAIPFEDPVFEGTMATDGESLDSVVLTSLIDTRDIGPLFDLGSDETAVCSLVGDLGVTCDACSDGEPLCLAFTAEWTNAPREAGIRLD